MLRSCFLEDLDIVDDAHAPALHGSGHMSEKQPSELALAYTHASQGMGLLGRDLTQERLLGYVEAMQTP